MLMWCRDNGIPALLAYKRHSKVHWNIRLAKRDYETNDVTYRHDYLIVRECDYELVRLRF